jgi:hypothetical protein
MVYSARHLARLRTGRATAGGPGKHFAATVKSALGPRPFNTQPANLKKLRQLRHRRAAAQAVHRTNPADIAVRRVSTMAVHNIP